MPKAGRNTLAKSTPSPRRSTHRRTSGPDDNLSSQNPLHTNMDVQPSPTPPHIRRPPNQFLLFLSDVRRSNWPEKSERDRSRVAGVLWRLMSDEEKKPWADKAQELMDEYKKSRSTTSEQESTEVGDSLGPLSARAAITDDNYMAPQTPGMFNEPGSSRVIAGTGAGGVKARHPHNQAIPTRETSYIALPALNHGAFPPLPDNAKGDGLRNHPPPPTWNQPRANGRP